MKQLFFSFLGILLLWGCSSKSPLRPRKVGTPILIMPDGDQERSSLPPKEQERYLEELLNRHRVAVGKAPLLFDERISEVARQHSVAMATGKISFGHGGFKERWEQVKQFLSAQRSAENVAQPAVSRSAAPATLELWLASSGHRINMEGDFSHAGVGAAQGASGKYFFTLFLVK